MQEYADEQRVEATRQELLSKRDASIEKIQSLRLQVGTVPPQRQTRQKSCKISLGT